MKLLTFQKKPDKTSTLPLCQPLAGAQAPCSPNQVDYPLPSPCAWCEREAGEVQSSMANVQSHTVCARHFCMTLLQGGKIPAQMIKDRVVRVYGATEGLAAFDAAVQLVAQEVAA